MRIAAIVALSLACAGCIGPRIPVTDVDEQSAAELASTVKILATSQTPAATALGAVTATSCKNKLWDKDATREDALAQLRHHVKARGGNAVGNVTCEGSATRSLRKNCWAWITCTGTAMKL